MSDSEDFVECFTPGIKLSDNPDSQGFDTHAGQTWIYPTNYPIREYQFNIIEKALLENTLVSLPTGLGKTFIAAVVMYNFYRWYPNGKVVFIAPTRPLVKQQIDACYNIMAIPQEVTIELTGTKLKKSRVEIWNSKRVFFVTPQILQNDLQSNDNLGSRIKCIVFDEAHKARGNHAYCEVIRKLMVQNNMYRVLALSATPGSNPSDMKEVIQNLLISHLEFRTEESPDVRSYVFERSLETVVVPLDSKLQQVKSDYLEVLERYTRCLINYKVIQGNCSALTKGKIFMTLKNFQAKNRGGGYPNYSEIMKNLNICVTLYHAYELLIRHGLRSFLSFFEEHINKPLLRGNTSIVQIMEDVSSYLGTLTIAEPLPDGTYTEVSNNIKFGHPKFYKLEEILVSHFREHKESRIIVFFEYRESVKEAYTLLMKNTPSIRPRIFLGQGSGVTQRQQIQVIQAFREGKCNTLLSTCIGEEGLDVGEVDLIVCFDISNKSPIRMIQRMGRTGRKREGRIIVLVTQGREQQTLQECLAQKKYLSTNLSSLPDLTGSLYRNNPRMIPDNIVPQCEKVYITVTKKSTKKNMNLKDMFKRRSNKASSSETKCTSQGTSVSELSDLPSATSQNKSNQLDADINSSESEINRKLRQDSEILDEIIRSADTFDIPLSQFIQNKQTKNLKQGDIRSIFKKVAEENKTKSSQDSDLSKKSLKDDLMNEISIYLSIKNMSDIKCRVCDNLFICPKLPTLSEKLSLHDWVPPDMSVLSSITPDSFIPYLPKNKVSENKIAKYDTRGSKNTFNEEIKMEVDNFIAAMEDTSLSNFDTQWKTLEDINAKPSCSKLISKGSIKESSGSKSINVEDNVEEILSFFKLESVMDFFGTDKKLVAVKPAYPTADNFDLVDENSNENIEVFSSPESPILCTFQRKENFKPKPKTSPVKLKLVSKNNRKQFNISPVKQQSTSSAIAKTPLTGFEEIEDIFDLSVFNSDSVTGAKGKDTVTNFRTTNILPSAANTNITSNITDTDDICDLSVFGLTSECKKRLHDNGDSETDKDDVGQTAKRQKTNDETLTQQVNNGFNFNSRCGIRNIKHSNQLGISSKLRGTMKLPPMSDLNYTNPLNSSAIEESQLSITQMLSFINRPAK